LDQAQSGMQAVEVEVPEEKVPQEIPLLEA
jgi:hypothetical protein